MLAHPAPEGAAGAGKAGAKAPAATTASAGPPSPSKWSSATGVSGGGGGGGGGVGVVPHHQSGAFAAHAHANAHAADVSLDTSCKEDFFCDENDGLLHYHGRHHHGQVQQHRSTAAAGAAAALGLSSGAAPQPPIDGAAVAAAVQLQLQRTGSFTSRMTPLPKEHQHDHPYPHHHQALGLLAHHHHHHHAAQDAPRWRPRAHDDQQPAAPQQPVQQKELPAPAADAEDADVLACGAAPLLSCCEALDFLGATPLPAAAAEAAVAAPAAAAVAVAAAAAAEARPSPLLHSAPAAPAPPPCSSASPSETCAAPAGAAAEFNAEVVLQLRNELQREAELRPSPDCLGAHGPDRSPDDFVTPQMRAIVVSWLSEVASEFSLQQETLFSAVSLLDRFLSGTDAVPRGVLQLAAVAACMVACKQDEVGGPTVEELVDVAAGCFRREDLLRMERILLDALGWRVRAPTAYTFLHLIGQALPLGLQPAAAALACYLTELAGLDYASLAAPPSAVAGAALLLAQASTAVGEGPSKAATVQWREVSALTGHAAEDLARLAAHLLGLQQQAEREAAAAARQQPQQPGSSPADDAAGNGSGGGGGAPSAFVREKYAAPAWLCASVARPPLEAFGPPPTTTLQ